MRYSILVLVYILTLSLYVPAYAASAAAICFEIDFSVTAVEREVPCTGSMSPRRTKQARKVTLPGQKKKPPRNMAFLPKLGDPRAVPEPKNSDSGNKKQDTSVSVSVPEIAMSPQLTLLSLISEDKEEPADIAISAYAKLRMFLIPSSEEDAASDAFGGAREKLSDPKEIDRFYHVRKSELEKTLLLKPLLSFFQSRAKGWFEEVRPVLTKPFDVDIAAPETSASAARWFSNHCYEQPASYAPVQATRCLESSFESTFVAYYGAKPTRLSAWLCSFLHRRFAEGGKSSVRNGLDVAATWQKNGRDLLTWLSTGSVGSNSMAVAQE